MSEEVGFHAGHRIGAAVGILRVSQVAGRTEERFHSPEIQRQAISDYCERAGLELVEVYDESRSVSGGLELENRPGLREAMKRIETGAVSAIVVSTLDRAFRNLDLQRQTLRRIREAGGDLHAVDEGGPVRIETAAQRFGVDVKGLVAEYHREVSREKAAAGQARAVARGAVPWANVPLGYLRRVDGTLEPDPATIPIVHEAFARRLRGESHRRIRRWLRDEHGIERTERGVYQLLSNRLLLGEIHFGHLANLSAHEPIIDRATFDAVQEQIIPRGPMGKSQRLLSRQGLLVCATCGSRLGADKAGTYPYYKCRGRDCERPASVSAAAIEEYVIDALKVQLADIRETAESDETAQMAAGQLDAAQKALDAAIEAFDGLESEPAVVAKIRSLKAARDEAQVARDRAVAAQNAQSVSVSIEDWDVLTLDEQRELVKAVISRIEVLPGRMPRGGRLGTDRVRVVSRV